MKQDLLPDSSFIKHDIFAPQPPRAEISVGETHDVDLGPARRSKAPQPSCLPCNDQRIAARGPNIGSSRPIWWSTVNLAEGNVARSEIQKCSAAAQE